MPPISQFRLIREEAVESVNIIPMLFSTARPIVARWICLLQSILSSTAVRKLVLY